MQVRTLVQAIAFGEVAAQYQQLRREHPTIRALTIKRYIRDNEGLTPEQFECATERGHEWSYSGSAYGGDDDSYFGEGRCYCCHCGADGDA
ncbi:MULTISPECIES: hypothetical protein [Burkholderia]|jgi:hypothetical protein|uniref:Uncharacterized protein n=1 Tax=Burkholderia orbicola TaxID=2978683 RepID=A0ABT8P1G2_9BURK|nr:MULTISPECIES: hypothetical protein [Burkholderia]MCS6428105.1 hypothetical protein [Burkholderia thailandensis]MCS6467195.1 hypothetical protein [Burkholderia thailandensis]MDN7527683.1 hypothetical protein [Burkholderia orbicola]